MIPLQNFFLIHMLCYATASFAQVDCPQATSLKIAECNNRTIESIMKDKSDCDIAVRLNSFAQWLNVGDKPCSTIVSDVAARYESFHDTAVFPINYTGVSWNGSSKAPIKIVAYISMSCPLCKRLYRDLTDSLKGNNRLKQIALTIKPFSATPLEHALIAAQYWKKEGDLLRALAPIKERITLEMALHITDSLGISRPEIISRMNSTEIAAFVESSRTEAQKNGVTVTPTFFINGKRYHGYKDAKWVLDAAEYTFKQR